MKSVSARELKNKTGEILRRVGQGEKVLIMKRGKPLAVLSPVKADELTPIGLREYEKAWKDIEKALRTSKPRYRNWQEAMRRTPCVDHRCHMKTHPQGREFRFMECPALR